MAPQWLEDCLQMRTAGQATIAQNNDHERKLHEARAASPSAHPFPSFLFCILGSTALNNAIMECWRPLLAYSELPWIVLHPMKSPQDVIYFFLYPRWFPSNEVVKDG